MTSVALDVSFGSWGVSLTDWGGRLDISSSLDLQPDGKIVVGGTSASFRDTQRKGNFTDAALCRLLPDGRLDPAWGSGMGKVLVELGGRIDPVQSVHVRPDGKVWVVGTRTWHATEPDRVAVALLNAEGRREWLRHYEIHGGTHLTCDSAMAPGGELCVLARAEEVRHGLVWLDLDGEPVVSAALPGQSTRRWRRRPSAPTGAG
jgi:hypothetical protein